MGISLRPLYGKIVIERDEPEAVTKAGIVLPEKSQEKPQMATVLAVGDGYLDEKTGERRPLSVAVGDRVIISKWSGNEIEINDSKYLIMEVSDVLAIVNDDTDE